MSRNSSKTCQCWINHYVNFWKRMSNSTGKVSTNNRLLIWKKTLPEAPVLKFFWSKQKCSFIGIFLLWGTRWMSVARTAYSICFKVFKQSREELRPNRERTFSRSFWMYIASSICIRVHVQSDHKPLESLFRKTLSSAPSRIQHMMLKVQKYDLDLR